ncbi:tetratricopeptide repeat protein 7B-like isoform X2 [Watersipora subatra]|uniref:tetratricopeptide repeat protein 7B-like isoform X2 n=1 Tax=Watersipora subatra TaxID=2589382 RepID=UPI00355C07C0
MTTKGKSNKLEADIERYRGLQNWEKAIELTKTQWNKSNVGLDVLSNLLQGEKELESYLLNNPPVEENVEMAKEKLVAAERHLRYVAQRCPKERETLKQEAVLLLGKLLFAEAKYAEALKEFDSINMDKLTLHLITNRMLKIYAEGLAVKAMCLEKLISQGKGKQSAENEELIIKYYEQSGDILLLYLQNRDYADVSSSPTYPSTMTLGAPSATPANADAIGSILEMAVQKSPLIHIEKGDVGKGVERFRELLRAVAPAQSKCLYRLILARQLAEVLLRGICGATYIPIKLQQSKPKGAIKASQYDSPNMFIPSNEEEEALLLLLIAEGMANKEAILERSAEHQQSRMHSYDNATAVYDLLAICLVRRSNCTILAEALERAMKFSYEEPHVWYQFALSLIETGKFDRAYLVLKECHRIVPKDFTILLLQAKLCYDKLHQIDDGIQLCEKAVELCEDPISKSKCLLLLATGYSYKLSECRVNDKREELDKQALSAYTEAYTLDNYNVEAAYRLGLHQALQRKLSDAFKSTRQALRLQPDHMNSLTLLSLLYSSEKNQEKALQVIKIALGEHPDTLSLLLVRCKLENSLGLFQQSLSTCSQMLSLWKHEYQSIQQEENRGTGLLERFTDNGKGLLLVADTANGSDCAYVELHACDDKGSVRELAAASKVEKALSEVASSYQSSLWVPHGPQHSWSVQAQIWIHLAEIYLEAGHANEAHECVKEAMAIFPLSHLASYMKGRVLEVEQNYEEAKSCFEAALSINPYHVKSMTYLGKTLHMMGAPKLAEKMLRDAVNADPTSHQAWKELGIVLESGNEHDTAAECLITAINLECSTPVLPFGTLLRVI